ncbi:MAG: bacteriohemerythrin [Burkholderiaceae bacterium]|nr:bacteriohemerythrin [Burkholderiaceae bacterium]
MTYFAWINSLNTGHSGIDNDHRQLIEMNNAFYQMIEEGKGREVLGEVLESLTQYYQMHFAREEAEMQRIGYQGFREHKQEHDKFIQEVSRLKQEFDSGASISPVLVARILNDWLCNHIVKTDTKLTAAISKSFKT